MTTYVYGLTFETNQGLNAQGAPWGTGEWGYGWGGAVLVLALSPQIVDEAGGSVLEIHGSGFTESTQAWFVKGGKEYPCYVLDPEFDVLPNKAYVATPVVPAGVYDLKVQSSLGMMTLPNAVDVRAFAYEQKVEQARRKWAPAWNLGPRLFGNGG